MRSKHLYIIFHLLSLYCNIGESAKRSREKTVRGANAESPAVQACQEIIKNYKPSSDDYIVSGKKAVLGEFPFMVAIGVELPDKNIYFYCGGSLISPTSVLTAAHCLDGKIEAALEVQNAPVITRAGSLDIGNTEFNPNTDVRAAEKILHPQYNSSQFYYDIALLRLPSTVKATPNVSPICLETNYADPEGQLVVTGWGRIKTNGPRSEALLKAYVEIVPQTRCKEMYKSNESTLPKGITKGQLCANDPSGRGQGTCYGDSGGPLFIAAKEGRSRLVGVTSFGQTCGTRTPVVYTRIFSYLPWIESTVWPN